MPHIFSCPPIGSPILTEWYCPMILSQFSHSYLLSFLKKVFLFRTGNVMVGRCCGCLAPVHCSLLEWRAIISDHDLSCGFGCNLKIKTQGIFSFFPSIYIYIIWLFFINHFFFFLNIFFVFVRKTFLSKSSQNWWKIKAHFFPHVFKAV